MNLRNPLIFMGLIAVLGWLMSAQASDVAKEKRWSDQIADALVVGEPQWLESGGHKFLGIYTEASTDTPRGAVILVHGIGVHPDWPDVIAPLRTELPERGWATLSIQMPVLGNEADAAAYAPLFAEVPGRIDAALAFLTGKGMTNVALVAHSLGASMSASYLAQKPAGEHAIKSFVAIGMPAHHGADARMDVLKFLTRITIPTYDLYGSQDLEAVRNSVAQRRQTASVANNAAYRQEEVSGANHFFNGLEATLIARVDAWLAGQLGD